MCRPCRPIALQHSPKLGNENGSEPASFALIMPLFLVLVLGITQLALALWVRTSLIDAAGAAARSAIFSNNPQLVAEETVRQALSSTVGAEYVQHVEVNHVNLATVSGAYSTADVDALEVRVTAPMPVVGLFGAGKMTVSGHAVIEEGP